MSETPIDRRIAREAAGWFVRLQNSSACAAEHAAGAEWRAQHADHERAWQLAERFSARTQQIAGGAGRAALERPRSLDRRRALKTLALLIVAAPLGLAAHRSLPWREWQADERTATGEQRALHLPDGAQIRLNTGSAVDIAYDDSVRRVRLIAGEMLVEVPREPAMRPFIVDTAEAEITLLGSRFLLRQYPHTTYLAALEGAVQVRPRLSRGDEGLMRLATGQQTHVNSQAAEPAVKLAQNRLDWLSGVLRAEKMRLDDFITELGRYRPGLLRCDPAVAGLLISGAFQLRDIDQILRALSQTLPVSVHYRTAYWVTVTARVQA
ncbi:MULTISPECIES: FecR domain-containing protein [unclassified Pseudomonas]|jgi:transmembrane sensor|uniref:FecR domain-containing protein n=1 Tax=unclassified Pseudomonas TaxID=196821 RepID=UPI00069FBF01|nr:MULTISPECIES: FecR domain-containing protein [unclassified Pseudomonas]MBY8949372.1 FecR domain-containing protein [Pseudomonas sp. SH10-3B]